MRKSLLLFNVCMAVCAFSIADQAPTSPPPDALQAARAACETDIQRFCAGVEPGGGRIIACMKQHKDEVSGGCKKAMAKVRQTS